MAITPLSSHTAKSLLSELIAGRTVVTSAGREFRLDVEAARRVLAWYSGRSAKWDRNVQKDDIEAIVNAAIANVPFNASPIATYRPSRSVTCISLLSAHTDSLVCTRTTPISPNRTSSTWNWISR
jgi:hypothetical protein